MKHCIVGRYDDHYTHVHCLFVHMYVSHACHLLDIRCRQYIGECYRLKTITPTKPPSTCMCLSSNHENGGGSPMELGLGAVLPDPSSFSGRVCTCSTRTESPLTCEHIQQGDRNSRFKNGHHAYHSQAAVPVRSG